MAEISSATLSEETVVNLLNFIGNHGAKAVTAAVITARPDIEFTPGSLARSLQPSSAYTSELPSATLLRTYVEHNFVPAGILEKPAAIESFRSAGGQFQRLAFLGNIMGWKLDFPELIPLQGIFGVTALKRSTLVRVPEVRLRLYQALHSFGDEYPTTAQLGARINDDRIPNRQLANNIRSLQERGMLVRQGNPYYPNVGFSPDKADAMATLVNDVNALQTDPEHVIRQYQRAFHILKRPDLMARIIEDGLKSSTMKDGSLRSGTPEATPKQILDYIRAADEGLSRSGIHTRLQQAGVHVSLACLKSYLTGFVKAGEIVIDRQEQESIYTAAPDKIAE